MNYLPHIELSIKRLGYIKPEYAPILAKLMAAHAGEHPHTTARAFRKRGTQLDAQTKRDLGVNPRAQFSAEAMDALTQRGLSDPIHGIEVTLLDASFSAFRSLSVRKGLDAGHDRFRLDGQSFLTECAGCRRLNRQIVTSLALTEIPPTDCEREACSIGMLLRIDFLSGLD